MFRNIAANLAQMAHPGVGFFYPEDRVLVVCGFPHASCLFLKVLVLQVNPLYHVYAMNTTTINLMVIIISYHPSTIHPGCRWDSNNTSPI